MAQTLIHNITIPLLIILSANILSFIRPLPVLLQILIDAVLAVHVGSTLAGALSKTSYKYIRSKEEELREGNYHETGLKKMWAIIKVPLIGCFFLLGLYLLIRQAGKLTTNIILNYLFVSCTFFYSWTFISPLT